MKDCIDFYFDDNYGKLYENIECGTQEIFEYEDENGKISNQFIKRKIDICINNSEYFDIVTPYGYGGPVIEKCSGSKEKLLENYETKFKEYCTKNNIVSEFIRFHPIIGNAFDFQKMYNPIYMRKTLVTNLKDYDDPVKSEFSKNCRKSIRQAINKGITYKIIEAPDDLNSLKNIYYETMNRNNATEYYYFADKYFEDLLKYYKNNMVLIEAIYEEKVIAVCLYFVYNKIIHVHLSGTLTEYLHLSPEYVLQYAITLWGKEKEYNLIHRGGGRSNSEDDSLYLFKKNFAKSETRDFYISKKIWNEDVYNKLCELKNVSKDECFFPAYRKK